MIPCCAVLCDSELVGVVILGGNGTLGDGVDSIILELVEHSYSVPVNCGAIVVKVVDDLNFDGITPASFDLRTWIYIVESLATIGAIDAVTVDVAFVDFQCVLESLALKQRMVRIIPFEQYRRGQNGRSL